MSRKRHPKHVTFDDQGDPTRVVLWCKHCDERFTVLLPASGNMFGAACNAFVREHRECEPVLPRCPVSSV